MLLGSKFKFQYIDWISLLIIIMRMGFLLVVCFFVLFSQFHKFSNVSRFENDKMLVDDDDGVGLLLLQLVQKLPISLPLCIEYQYIYICIHVIN